MKRSARRRLACAAAFGCIAGVQGLHAEDLDPALAAFARPTVAARRVSPPDAIEWEARLRTRASFGPPPLRSADAALLEAVRAGHWADAMALVKSGQANPNARDDAGGLALVYAAAAGRDELVRELVKRGAELDRIGDQGFTALGAAAFNGRRSTLRLLLRAGADAERWGATGHTPLQLAAVAGQVDAIGDLLALHADLEGLSRTRETALDIAANAGQQEAMDRLIAAGADATRAGAR